MPAAFATVPPFTVPERLAAWDLPGVARWDFHKLRWHVVRAVKARRVLEAALRRDPADVVHVITDQVALLLGTGGPPWVPSLDSTTVDWVRTQLRLAPDAPLPRQLAPLAALERRALERAPLCIAWTETIADQIARLAPRARTAVVHPGLDPEAFRPPGGERRPGPLRVLFVGGRWEEKGGPDLVAALGEDMELHAVTPAAVDPRPGLTVHRAGPGSPELRALFADADVLALPTYVDATPWVVLEALASGLPVVASRIGSIPELAGDAGVMVAPGDVRALREALAALRDDPARRAALGAAGPPRIAERYDARANTRRLLDLLAGVTDGPGTRGRTPPP